MGQRMTSFERQFPLAIGTEVKPYGRIGAVGIRDGERYYVLVDKHGDVALMPGSILERHADSASAERNVTE